MASGGADSSTCRPGSRVISSPSRAAPMTWSPSCHRHETAPAPARASSAVTPPGPVVGDGAAVRPHRPAFRARRPPASRPRAWRRAKNADSWWMRGDRLGADRVHEGVRRGGKVSSGLRYLTVGFAARQDRPCQTGRRPGENGKTDQNRRSPCEPHLLTRVPVRSDGLAYTVAAAFLLDAPCLGSPSVLLFDSDTEGRETLATGSRGSGEHAEAAPTPPRRRADPGRPAPDVLVVVLRGTRGPGRRFLLATSSRDGGPRSLPRLVLAAAAELPEELRQLPGERLPGPARLRPRRDHRLQAAGGGTAGQRDRSRRQRRRHRAVGHAVRIRAAASSCGRWSGWADRGSSRWNAANRKGELRFSEGEVVSAQLGSLQGQAALHQLLLWEEAALDISFRAVAARGQYLPQRRGAAGGPDRFLRDFAHATKNVGHPQSLFVQDAEKVASLVDAIPAEVVPVMRLFDGQRSLGDVLEDSPFRVFDTLKISAGWWRWGSSGARRSRNRPPAWPASHGGQGRWRRRRRPSPRRLRSCRRPCRRA